MRKAIVLSLLAILFYSCSNEGSGNLIRIQYDWILNMNFCGEILAEQRLTEGSSIQIEHQLGGVGIDPIKMVIAGASEVGIASIEKVLAANKKGADLVIIGFANHVSPTVFLSLEDSLSNLKDLNNKSIGLAPGSATEFIYRSLISTQKINEATIEEVPADFDIRGFVKGLYDIRPAFVYVEPIDLELSGISYSMLEPKDFGLAYPGRVYFVKRSFMSQNKDLLKRFIFLLAEGWDLARENNKLAIEELQKVDPQINLQREMRSLQIGEFYIYGFQGEVLNADTSLLSSFAKDISKTGLVRDADHLFDQIDLSLVDEYHEFKKKETNRAKK